MTRWQAAGRHLAISAVIATPLLVLMAWIWYPPPLFLAAGAAKLALTIIGVDVVAGPTLTAIVYKEGKWGMTFDLWVIGLLQAGALVFGLFVAFDSRPAYIVATPGAASLVHANELFYDPPALRERLPRPPLWGAEWVAVRSPADEAEQDRRMEYILRGEPDVDRRPELFVPIADEFDPLYASARPLSQLGGAADGARETIATWKEENGVEGRDDLRALPLLTRNRELALVLDPRRREAIGLLDLVVE